MKTRILRVLLLIVLPAFLSGCQNEPHQIQIAQEKIEQKIEVAGMGQIQDFKIDSISQINESTFFARHRFQNPMVNKEVRVSRLYHFNEKMELQDNEDLLVEIKSGDKWIPTKL